MSENVKVFKINQEINKYQKSIHKIEDCKNSLNQCFLNLDLIINYDVKTREYEKTMICKSEYLTCLKPFINFVTEHPVYYQKRKRKT